MSTSPSRRSVRPDPRNLSPRAQRSLVPDDPLQGWKWPSRRRGGPLAVALIIGLFGLSAVFASDGEAGKRQTPLDLPSGGVGDGEHNEDAPEPILFYGSVYEGDGYFFCLDRSGSMSAGGRLEQMKEEVIEVVRSLSENTEFSLVSFSSGWSAWSVTPKEASTGNRNSAEAWVNSLVAGGTTCMGSAAVQTLNIAQRSQKDDKQIIILSDGVPYCGGQFTSGQVLSAVAAANYEALPIHTVFVSSDPEGIAFMNALAMNGGTARSVD